MTMHFWRFVLAMRDYNFILYFYFHLKYLDASSKDKYEK